jgi:hypothetical protein
VDGKKKDIAPQNPATNAIRLQVNKVILETNKLRQIDLGRRSGLLYFRSIKKG